MFGIYALMDGLIIVAGNIGDDSKRKWVPLLEGSVSGVAAAIFFFAPQLELVGFRSLIAAREILTGMLGSRTSARYVVEGPPALVTVDPRAMPTTIFR